MNYWLLCIECTWLQICLHAHSRSLYSSTLSCGVSYYLQDEVYSGLLRFHHTTTAAAGGGGRVGRGEDVHLRSTTTTEQLLPELAKRFTLANSSSSSSSHCHIALVQGESRFIVSANALLYNDCIHVYACTCAFTWSSYGNESVTHAPSVML